MIGALELSEDAGYFGESGWRVYEEALKRGAYVRPRQCRVYHAGLEYSRRRSARIARNYQRIVERRLSAVGAIVETEQPLDNSSPRPMPTAMTKRDHYLFVCHNVRPDGNSRPSCGRSGSPEVYLALRPSWFVEVWPRQWREPAPPVAWICAMRGQLSGSNLRTYSMAI